jgi:hypothetical protein
MFTVDPWQLLGVTPTSSIHDARKSYYYLARIMHPDHGGNADDMRTLHEAYTWIYKQLTGSTFPITVDDPAKTPIMEMVIGMDRDAVGKRYDELKKTEDKRTRIMVLDWIKYAIERDAMEGKNLRDVNEYLMESIENVSKAQEAMYPSSIEEGYGSLMYPTEPRMNYADLQKDTYPPHTVFSKEIAVYKEPICPTLLNMAEESLCVPKSKEDYSGNKEKLSMTDYMVAYSHHVISNTEQYEKEKLEKLANALKDMEIKDTEIDSDGKL